MLGQRAIIGLGCPADKDVGDPSSSSSFDISSEKTKPHVQIGAHARDQVQELQVLCEQVKQSANMATRSAGKDLILLIGKTGAGKTTLIHHLCGKTIIPIKPSDQHVLQVPPGSNLDQGSSNSDIAAWEIIEGAENSNQQGAESQKKDKGRSKRTKSNAKKRYDVQVRDRIPGLKVGHGAESETSAVHIVDPNDYFSLEGRKLPLIGDSPGFIDTNGAFKDIANNVAIHSAVSNAKSVRLCLVVSYDSVREGRCDNLREILSCAANMLKDLAKCVDSLAIVMTHVPKEMAVVDVAEGEEETEINGDLDDLLKEIFESIMESTRNSSNNPAMLNMVQKLLAYVNESIAEDGLPVEKQMIRPYHPEIHSSPENIWKMLLHRTPITNPSQAFDMPLAQRSVNEIELFLSRYETRIQRSLQSHPFDKENAEFLLCMFRLCTPFIRMQAVIPPIIQHLNHCRHVVQENYDQRWMKINSDLHNLIVNASLIQPAQLHSISPALHSLRTLFDNIVSLPENDFDLKHIKTPVALIGSCVQMTRDELVEKRLKQHLATYKSDPDSLQTTWILDASLTLDKIQLLRQYFSDEFGDNDDAAFLSEVYGECVKATLALFAQFVGHFRKSVAIADGDELSRLRIEREHFNILLKHEPLRAKMEEGMKATSVHMSEKYDEAVNFIDDFVQTESFIVLANKFLQLPMHWNTVRHFEKAIAATHRPDLQYNTFEVQNTATRNESDNITATHQNSSEHQHQQREITKENNTTSRMRDFAEKFVELIQIHFADVAPANNHFYEYSSTASSASNRESTPLAIVTSGHRPQIWLPSIWFRRLVVEIFCLQTLSILDENVCTSAAPKIRVRLQMLEKSTMTLVNPSQTASQAGCFDRDAALGQRGILTMSIFLCRILDTVSPETNEVGQSMLEKQLRFIVDEASRNQKKVLKDLEEIEKRRKLPDRSSATLEAIESLFLWLNNVSFVEQYASDWEYALIWISNNQVIAEIRQEDDMSQANSSSEYDQQIAVLVESIFSSKLKITSGRQHDIFNFVSERMKTFENDLNRIDTDVQDAYASLLESQASALHRFISTRRWNDCTRSLGNLERLCLLKINPKVADLKFSDACKHTAEIIKESSELIINTLDDSTSWHLPETWCTISSQLENIINLNTHVSSLCEEEDVKDTLSIVTEKILTTVATFAHKQNIFLEQSDGNRYGLEGNELPFLPIRKRTFKTASISSENNKIVLRILPCDAFDLFEEIFSTLNHLESSNGLTTVRNSLKTLEKEYKNTYTSIMQAFSSAVKKNDAKAILEILERNKDAENSERQHEARGIYGVMVQYLNRHLKLLHQDIDKRLAINLQEIENSLNAEMRSESSDDDLESLSRVFQNVLADGSSDGEVASAWNRNVSEFPAGAPPLLSLEQHSASRKSSTIRPDLLESLRAYHTMKVTLRDHLKVIRAEASESLPSSLQNSSNTTAGNRSGEVTLGNLEKQAIAVATDVDHMASFAQEFYEFLIRVKHLHIKNKDSPCRLKAGLILLDCNTNLQPTIGKAFRPQYERDLLFISAHVKSHFRFIVDIADSENPQKLMSRLKSVEAEAGFQMDKTSRLIKQFKKEGIKGMAEWLHEWLSVADIAISNLETYNSRFVTQIEEASISFSSKSTNKKVEKDYASKTSTLGTEIFPPIFYLRIIEEGMQVLPDEFKSSSILSPYQKKILLQKEKFAKASAQLINMVKDVLQYHDSEIVTDLLCLNINPKTLAVLLDQQHQALMKHKSSTSGTQAISNEFQGSANDMCQLRFLSHANEVLESQFVTDLESLFFNQRQNRVNNAKEIIVRFFRNEQFETSQAAWDDIHGALELIAKEIAGRKNDSNGTDTSQRVKGDNQRLAFDFTLSSIFQKGCNALVSRLQYIQRNFALISNKIFPTKGNPTEENLILNSLQVITEYLRIVSIVSIIKSDLNEYNASGHLRRAIEKVDLSHMDKIDRSTLDRLETYNAVCKRYFDLWEETNLNDDSPNFKEIMSNMQWIIKFLHYQSEPTGNNEGKATSRLSQYFEAKNIRLGEHCPDDSARSPSIIDLKDLLTKIQNRFFESMKLVNSGITVENCGLILSNVLLQNRLEEFLPIQFEPITTFYDCFKQERILSNDDCRNWINKQKKEASEFWNNIPKSDDDWKAIENSFRKMEAVEQAASTSLLRYLGLDPSVRITEIIIQKAIDFLTAEKTAAFEEIETREAGSDTVAVQEATVMVMENCKRWSYHLPHLAGRVKVLIKNLLDEVKKHHGNKSVIAIGHRIESAESPLLKEVLDEHPQAFKSINTVRFNMKAHLGEMAVIDNMRYKSKLTQIAKLNKVEKDGLINAYDSFKATFNKLIDKHVVRGVPLDDLIKEIKTVSTASFNRENLPALLAKIFALWSTLESEGSYDVTKNEQSINRPHPVQVIGIMRLLGVGFVTDNFFNIYIAPLLKHVERLICKETAETIQFSLNHLAEIKTGEGKSVALAILCIVFALMGQYPCCVCYSELLSQRDYDAFKSLFDVLGVSDRIAYSTITNLCEVMVNRGMDIREQTKRAVGFHTDKGEDDRPPPTTSNVLINGSMAGFLSTEPLKRVLIVDEVDILFSENFYGRSYNPSALFQSENTKNLVLYMWDNRSVIKSVREIFEESHFSNVLAEFYHDMKQIIQDQVEAMWNDLKRIDQHHYELQAEIGMIGYKRNGKISFHHEGFKTMFAYIQEFRKGTISEASMSKHVGISLLCGRYAYASLMREFGLILGVTGTLSDLSQFERDAMERNYSILNHTYFPSIYGESHLNFKEHDDVRVLFSKDEWYRYLQQQAQTAVNEHRSALVFFETKEALDSFQHSGYCEFQDIKSLLRIVEGETQHMNELVKKATHSRTVTLATRAFGRGIDFVCRDAIVTLNKGVHVIHAFFCDTVTEEVQIKGRTARQGDPGSYELAIFASDVIGRYSISSEELREQTKGRRLYQYLNGLRKRAIDDRVKDRQQRVAESNKIHLKSMEFFEQHLPNFTADSLECLRQIQLAGNIKKVTRTSPLHTIVCIDISSSMAGKDSKPSDSAPEHQQNRLGCVVEATKKYISMRLSKSPDDLISIIAFDHHASVILEAKSVGSSEINDLLDGLAIKGATNFDPAIRCAREIIEKQVAGHLESYIFFLSDGDGGCSTALDDVADLHQKDKKFRIDTIIFGPSLSGKATLQTLANRGGGKFLESVSSTEELEEIMIEASERYF